MPNEDEVVRREGKTPLYGRPLDENGTIEFTKPTKPKPKGADAIVSVEIQSSEGSITRMFNITGFTANTLAWQRQGPALDEMLKAALSKLGPVTLVR